LPDHARDHDRTGRRLRTPARDRLLGEAQHRFEQADRRIANGELRRVYTDRQAAGAGVAVVPRERGLPALVERPLLGQRERNNSRRSDGRAAASVAAIGHFEVGRLVQRRSSGLYPVRHPLPQHWQ